MDPQLTKRQSELLEYLREVHHQTGVMPSTREIQAHFGFASQTAAVTHLRALEKKGVIQRTAGKARALAFPEELEREEIIDVPLYGQIPAGMPTDSQEESDGCISIDVSTLGVSRNARTFALRVRGDSMIDAHICDGDTVILEFKEARPGDVVAALIDGETTLKRLVREGGKSYLKAENEDYPDLLPVHDLVIQGVMVMLLRMGDGKRRVG
ncbi:transcriptional repressor LexA [Sulfuriroseicoccus oceanibius]|uniref:Repressor LexA n=1 Tax=Sulfuriroseicoccus oceanibius TaxID=2707525 RepID=A0A6B3LAR6_9BACT|nr:transcriptional repressor LexA [Sulfuriroseicoccus oceanibius]QQL44534.1 repressor LexA [Sulfuriroseicoccus oceanibius]